MVILYAAVFLLIAGGPAFGQVPASSDPVASSPAAPPPPPPSDARLRKQLHDLDREIGVLESLMVGRGHGRGLLEKGLGWSGEQTERGFFLYSTDGLFRLHLNGGLQVDYAGAPGGQPQGGPETVPDGFLVRRVRPVLDFRIATSFRGQIMPDLASSFPLFNAFIDYDRFDFARIRVGVFKPTFSVENQQGEFDLALDERSFVQNFALRRSYGVQITGRILRRQLRYDLSVVNSNNGVIGARNRPLESAGGDMMGMGRLMATPFLLRGPATLRKLDVGVGVGFGPCKHSTCQQPMLTMGQNLTIFDYEPSVTGNGFTTRIMPQMTWFWRRVGTMAGYIYTWEPKVNQTTQVSTTLSHQAWFIQGEFALTDDEPAYNRITPRRPLSFSKAGHWGAWSLTLRYAEQRLDPKAFSFGFANTSLYSQAAKGISVGLTWYANREVRVQAVWEHTDLQGAGPAYQGPGTDNLLVTRLSLVY